jgi:PKD repeat protein
MASSTVALLLFGASPSRAAPQSGVDCACSAVGDYLSPIPAVPALPANGLTGLSPMGKYRVSAMTGLLQAAAVTVTRVEDNAVLINDDEAADWGFSPDDDRFVVAKAAVNGSPASIQVFDLTAVPAKVLVNLTPSAAGSAVSFSPNGVYLVDVELTPTPTSVALQVWEASTGTPVYSDGFNFAAPVGTGAEDEELGAVALGFGPDLGDRTLTYWYLTGGTASQWTAVNLTTAVRVVNRAPPAAFTPGFSPCGDAIGAYLDQPGALREADVYATLVSSHLGGSGTFPASDTTTESVTAASHVVTHNTTTEVLAANTAAATCSGPPNMPPTAAFTAPSTAPTLISVGFTDHSTDSDGHVVAWLWTFGDGQSSNLRNPTHTYGTVGTLTVKLTVTDNQGAQSSVSHSILVTLNQPPVASFTFTPATPSTREAVTFTDTSTDDDGVAREDWLIDGVFYSGAVVSARACPPMMTVTLTAYDHGGQSDQVTQQIPVTVGATDVPVDAGTDLRTALAGACPGDTVVLAPGHYTGGLTVPAKVNMAGAGMGQSFIDGFGADSSQWVLQLSTDLVVSNLTVTGGGAPSFSGSPVTAGGGILFVAGASLAGPSRVQAVEVMGNRGNGGIWIKDDVNAAEILSCKVHDNHRDNLGAQGASGIGMDCCGSVTVDHTEIASNTAADGQGAAFLWEANGVVFTWNNVHDNDAVGLSAQVVSGDNGGPADIRLSRFASNGAGVATDGAVQFLGNLVVQNRGDGLDADHAEQLVVVNSTLSDNTGTGLSAPASRVWNTILSGNGTNQSGTFADAGSNLIGGSPGFVGAGDYHLAPGSAAIDTGDNTAVPTILTTDADGDARILNGGSGTARVDIGWDEFSSGPHPPPVDAGPTDAGAVDAGASDAGTPGTDAGVDAGVDAGTDGGSAPVTDSGGGCGCNSGPSSAQPLWLLPVLWLLVRRRRGAAY